jgi:4-amino-4-deoxy-L-arabinose transferase-like glycosyltransferase
VLTAVPHRDGMSTTAIPARARPRLHAPAWTRALARRPELVALLVLAGVLNLWSLSTNGVANEYYAAAVRSMSESWHAFLYGAFDQASLQTVDKPPLALWVQALSVRAFGYSSWSLLVPQALMGAGTVALTYDLVRRRFGRAAGFAGGLALALTPIAVAISRHNNPDALLILCCTGALWATVRGLEDGRTRWLVLAGVLIGLGFETKMAVALMVLPGIAAAWLWVAPRGRIAALRSSLAAGAAMLAVGLAWPVLVWLTPAADRPWISGTDDNSIWSLILGYNGLGRLVGQSGGNTGGGMGGGIFGGDTGPFRLLNDSLGGQAGWLLGTAIVAGGALLVLTRLRRADARTGWLLAVGGAFATTAVAFSTAQGIFHPYYVSLLAPFSAALVGAGAGLALEDRRLARTLGAAALAGGVVSEYVVLQSSATELSWLAPLLVIGVGAAALAIHLTDARRVRGVAVAAALALLLVAPATWAVQTLGHATSGTFPAGGPASAGMTMGGGPGGGGGGGGGQGGPGGGGQGGPPSGGTTAGGGNATAGGGQAAGGQTPSGGTASSGTATGGTTSSSTATGGQSAGGGQGGGAMFGGNSQSLTQALAYAKAHGGGTIAVSSQSTAAAAILDSGGDVAGIGGFSGNETQVSASWLADEVAAGHIRYVLTSSEGGGISAGRVGATEIMALVQKVGKQTTVDGLYDLQGLAAALRAAA